MEASSTIRGHFGPKLVGVHPTDHARRAPHGCHGCPRSSRWVYAAWSAELPNRPNMLRLNSWNVKARTGRPMSSSFNSIFHGGTCGLALSVASLLEHLQARRFRPTPSEMAGAAGSNTHSVMSAEVSDSGHTSMFWPQVRRWSFEAPEISLCARIAALRARLRAHVRSTSASAS